MNSKKILHVVAGMNPISGGVAMAVKMIVRCLETRGITNTVVSLDDPTAKYLNDYTFEINTIGPGKTSWNYNCELAAWLKRNLTKFDVVIVHGLWLFTGYATFMALRKIKRDKIKLRLNQSIPKLLVMPHGMLDPYFQLAKNRKFKALRNFLYWKFVERKIISEADAVLFTSEEEKRLAQMTFQPFTPNEQHVIGLSIDEPPNFETSMSEAFIKSCPLTTTEPYLLFLGRIHSKKGIDLLINSYIGLYTSTNRLDCLTNGFPRNTSFPKLVIAGPGHDSRFGKILKKIVGRHAELEKMILFPGMLLGNAKWGALYGCDAFVLPSHQENFGIAVVEALACGKPVLISNKINIWSDILNSSAGLVADDSLDGTKLLLKEWIDLSINKKNAMSKSAVTCFHKNFSFRSASQKIVSIF